MDFERFRVADSVGAILLADISHPSGLIAKVVK
jgi:glycine hydroxymethyltransferase